MLPAEVKALCLRINKLYDQHDMNALAALHAPDYKAHSSGLPNGEADLEGWLMFVRAIWSAFPDLRHQLEDTIIEGDKAVARLVLSGTQQGELQGIPPTGKAVRVVTIDIARYENGKVKEEWAEFNMVSMLQQLGVMPMPGSAVT